MAKSNWFEELSFLEKVKYLMKHPRSKKSVIVVEKIKEMQSQGVDIDKLIFEELFLTKSDHDNITKEELDFLGIKSGVKNPEDYRLDLIPMSDLSDFSTAEFIKNGIEDLPPGVIYAAEKLSSTKSETTNKWFGEGEIREEQSVSERFSKLNEDVIDRHLFRSKKDDDYNKSMDRVMVELLNQKIISEEDAETLVFALEKGKSDMANWEYIAATMCKNQIINSPNLKEIITEESVRKNIGESWDYKTDSENFKLIHFAKMKNAADKLLPATLAMEATLEGKEKMSDSNPAVMAFAPAMNNLEEMGISSLVYQVDESGKLKKINLVRSEEKVPFGPLQAELDVIKSTWNKNIDKNGAVSFDRPKDFNKAYVLTTGSKYVDESVFSRPDLYLAEKKINTIESYAVYGDIKTPIEGEYSLQSYRTFNFPKTKIDWDSTLDVNKRIYIKQAVDVVGADTDMDGIYKNAILISDNANEAWNWNQNKASPKMMIKTYVAQPHTLSPGIVFYAMKGRDSKELHASAEIDSGLFKSALSDGAEEVLLGKYGDHHTKKMFYRDALLSGGDGFLDEENFAAAQVIGAKYKRGKDKFQAELSHNLGTSFSVSSYINSEINVVGGSAFYNDMAEPISMALKEVSRLKDDKSVLMDGKAKRVKNEEPFKKKAILRKKNNEIKRKEITKKEIDEARSEDLGMEDLSKDEAIKITHLISNVYGVRMGQTTGQDWNNPNRDRIGKHHVENLGDMNVGGAKYFLSKDGVYEDDE